MLILKYRPKTLDEYIGNLELKKEIKSFVLNWNPNVPVFIIEGPPGSGKTCLIESLANDLKLHLVKIDEDSINSFDPTSKSILDKNKIYLLQDIVDDKIKNTKFPIFIETTEAWKIKSKLNKAGINYRHSKINVDSGLILKILKNIAEKENLDISLEELKFISNHNETITSAINSLETIKSRFYIDNIFRDLNLVLGHSKNSSPSYLRAYLTLQKIPYSDYLKWINYIYNNVSLLYDLKLAIEIIAYSEYIFRTRTKLSIMLSKAILANLSMIPRKDGKIDLTIKKQKTIDLEEIDKYAKLVKISRAKFMKEIQLYSLIFKKSFI
jgi:DNA polymerase III delta prime subunit